MPEEDATDYGWINRRQLLNHWPLLASMGFFKATISSGTLDKAMTWCFDDGKAFASRVMPAACIS